LHLFLKNIQNRRPRRERRTYIYDFSRGGLDARLRASKPCSEVTNIGSALSSWAVFWLDFVKIKMQWVDLRNRTEVLYLP
jgi:hypothetical protein